MCLVSICPKGTAKDTEEVYNFIRSGAKSNGAGSGFMYKKNGSQLVTVKKGYFDVEKLIADLKLSKLTVDDELVIHHRIPTSGDRNDINTHPFVCSNIHEEVCNVDITINKPVLAHNGMFDIEKYRKINPNMSDTYAFARYILGNENILKLLYQDKELFEFALEDVLGSNKIAILFPDRDYMKIGYFIEDKGYYHSNSGYNRYVHNAGGIELDDDITIENSILNNLLDHHNFQNRNKQLSIGFKSAKESACVFREHEVSGNDRTRENRHQSTPSSTQSNLTKIVLLDNRYIDINDSNIKHFNYIRKTSWETNKANKSGIDFNTFTIEKFDSDCEFQSIQYKDGQWTQYKTIRTDVLVTGCYYIPKGHYYYEIYNDYKMLVDFSIEPTKNGIKSLQKILDKNYKKTQLDVIFYKKLDRKFCKKALQLHLEDLKRGLELTPLRKLAIEKLN